jgi:hypothetical protein
MSGKQAPQEVNEQMKKSRNESMSGQMKSRNAACH